MPAYVALLRAVNIGQRQTPMARVRDALGAAGFTDVQTYIQTGNVLLTSSARSPARVAEQLEAATQRSTALRDWTQVRPAIR